METEMVIYDLPMTLEEQLITKICLLVAPMLTIAAKESDKEELFGNIAKAVYQCTQAREIQEQMDKGITD